MSDDDRKQTFEGYHLKQKSRVTFPSTHIQSRLERMFRLAAVGSARDPMRTQMGKDYVNMQRKHRKKLKFNRTLNVISGSSSLHNFSNYLRTIKDFVAVLVSL